MMILISVILFVVLVVAAFLGRRVRHYLPEDHLSADSKDAVKLAMGLVATMTALVLGLLVSSAKGTYDTARSEVIQMAAKVAFLDRVLALYGPEAADARGELRAAVTDAARRIWSTDPGRAPQLTPNQQAGDKLTTTIQQLSPHDDTQRALKSHIAHSLTGLHQRRARPVLLAFPAP